MAILNVAIFYEKTQKITEAISFCAGHRHTASRREARRARNQRMDVISCSLRGLVFGARENGSVEEELGRVWGSIGCLFMGCACPSRVHSAHQPTHSQTHPKAVSE